MNSVSNSQALGYLSLRLAIGTTMLFHGLSRIGYMHIFVEKTSGMFVQTWLPRGAVEGFLYTVAPVELIIGLFLLPGLFTRTALFAGGLWMVLLIFGSTLIENFQVVGIQLIYALIFSLLLFHHSANYFSIDTLVQQKRSPDRLAS